MNSISKRLVIGYHKTETGVFGRDLFTEVPLQGHPTAIYKTKLLGVDCSIFLRPLPEWRSTRYLPWLQRSLSIRNSPELDHALRTGRLIFGKRPKRSLKLEAFVVFDDLGEVFEAYSNHSDHGDDWHDLFAERMSDAYGKDSFIITDSNRRFFFRDIADAALFKMKWS